MKNPHYRKVRLKRRLYSAWRRVYENGISSKSKETREQVKEFNASALHELERISDHLYKDKFVFSPATGIPQKRPGKTPRPIVKSPISSRIVQRSLLDVLQEEPSIQQYISIPTSFGGIEKRGVTPAVKTAYDAMQNGSSWYIRSDIEGFFAKIPRADVLRIISDVIPDNKFNLLLEEAVNTELSNLAELGKHVDLFPIYDIGVAQGCCLSPLMGNLLLHDFDAKMNEDGIICLRYIDDFIILGATEQDVYKAFKKAKKILALHKLKPYSPNDGSEKAQVGKTVKGFDFLGCEIISGLIRPARKSRQKLLRNVDELFKSSVQLMSDPANLYKKRKSFIDTLDEASNIIRGWGNQYSFCNDSAVINHLDDEIEKRVQKYIGCYAHVKDTVRSDHRNNRRRLLGVHLLCDSKSDPIIK